MPNTSQSPSSTKERSSKRSFCNCVAHDTIAIVSEFLSQLRLIVEAQAGGRYLNLVAVCDGAGLQEFGAGSHERRTVLA